MLIPTEMIQSRSVTCPQWLPGLCAASLAPPAWLACALLSGPCVSAWHSALRPCRFSGEKGRAAVREDDCTEARGQKCPCEESRAEHRRGEEATEERRKESGSDLVKGEERH